MKGLGITGEQTGAVGARVAGMGLRVAGYLDAAEMLSDISQKCWKQPRCTPSLSPGGWDS